MENLGQVHTYSMSLALLAGESGSSGRPGSGRFFLYSTGARADGSLGQKEVASSSNALLDGVHALNDGPRLLTPLG